jgi:thioesterase domain-containing protein
VAAKEYGHLVPLRATGKNAPLFCVHPAGGHVFCYLPLVQELGPEQPVFGLQASGLEEGEIPATSIEETALHYVEAIQTVQPQGPYRLLGMSSGGLLAYEMARQMSRSGAVVDFLALLDTTVPGAGGETMLSDEYLLQAVAGELGCDDLLRDSPGISTLEQLVDRGLAVGRLPEGFSLQQAARISGVFRNTVQMHLAYRPGKWVGKCETPALLVRALRRERAGDSLPDWSPYLSAAAVVDLDCRHGDLVSAAMASTIANLLAPHLT